ncbi:T9SS type A sorting domain-containing protein [Taibaiella chishuiensis]|uniref:Putative secreted protein (Por secretion system target) n=1 Tax=Taibaiella chishuiensis TaxID=1434707 RepID=A0A2P8DCU6_9BACT|nr:T9SS type A sorting domain-containing protein [Taibaiella chishuiensis]PSK95044.1 putative secreted protein (Por secretion system target) [Taibaiella chishuiensis]
MKKIGLSLVLLVACAAGAQAQIGKGGVPESVQLRNDQQYVPVHTAVLPDWASFLQKEKAAIAAGTPKPLTLSLSTPTDISFPASGSITTLDNGRRIWRSQLRIDQAPAIGCYYDRFHLPQGVKYYISNGNGAQILGAFTSENNTPSGHFANEAVQGNLVNLELDIDAGVDLKDIDFHIYRSAVYFRSYEYLNAYEGMHTIDFIDTALDGSASVCTINAICPPGSAYSNQRKATVQILDPFGGACSATMINNTGNSPASCKQYLLTASHCQGENDTVSSAFDEMIVRFNFERAQCTGGGIPESRSMVGLNFVSRSIFDEDAIRGDFLLLEMRQTIPLAWNVTLNGWNRDANHALTVAAPKKFIGFHHPSGDVKKVTTSQSITGSVMLWTTVIDTGYGARGSSGSGFFDGDGNLIGIASTAAILNDMPCGVNAHNQQVDYFRRVNYSKLAFDWDYSVDGPNPKRKLKPWLDPANTGVVTLNGVKSNCTALEGSGTAIRNDATQLSDAISVYPNPSTNGKVTAQINLKEATDLSADIYAITGKKQQHINLGKVRSGVFTFDLGNYANGMYLINFSDGAATATRKVMLAR